MQSSPSPATASDVLSRDDVMAAYRYILGRPPENDGVIEHHLKAASIRALRERLFKSPEFRKKYAYEKPWDDAWVIAPIANNLRLWINLRDAFVSRGCLRGTFDPSSTKFIMSTLNKGDVFLDVGANIGWFTILAADRVGPEGRVISFEPRTDINTMLKKSVTENAFGDRVTVHGLALGEAAGEMELVWSRLSDNFGGTHLSPTGKGNFDGHETVKIARLDDVVPLRRPIRLVKMDAEGAEPLIFRGAAALLHECRPIILCEIGKSMVRNISGVSADDFLAQLRQLGYGVWKLSPDGAKGAAVGGASDLEGETSNVILQPV